MTALFLVLAFGWNVGAISGAVGDDPEWIVMAGFGLSALWAIAAGVWRAGDKASVDNET